MSAMPDNADTRSNDEALSQAITQLGRLVEASRRSTEELHAEVRRVSESRASRADLEALAADLRSLADEVRHPRHGYAVRVHSLEQAVDTGGDSWSASRMHIKNELKDLKDLVRSNGEKADGRLETLSNQFRTLDREVAAKGGMWGLLAAIVTTIVVSLLKTFFTE